MQDAEVEAPASMFSFEVAVDAPSAYVYKGSVLQSGGWISQPSFTVSLNLPFLQNENYSITPYVNAWSSIHQKAGKKAATTKLYERDFYYGADVESGDFALGFFFANFKHGSTTEEEAWEIGNITVSASYSGIFLNPAIEYFSETDLLTDGAEAHSGLALSLEPAIYETDDISVSISTLAAISLKDYYTNADGANETLGYYSVALNGAKTISDNLSIKTSMTYTGMTCASLKGLNEDKSSLLVLSAGLAFSF